MRECGSRSAARLRGDRGALKRFGY